MHDALRLLESLDRADLDWIFSHGVEQQVLAHGEVVREGARPEAIWIVLEGLVEVTLASRGDQAVARLGPGELIGEMSFLEDEPATATVRAEETSLLLELPHAKLRQRTAEDQGFAARLYRAIAIVENRRLKRAVVDLGELWADRGQTQEVRDDRWQQLAGGIEALQALMAETDKLAIQNDGAVPDERAAEVVDMFSRMSTELNEAIGDQSGLSEQVRADLGRRVQRKLLPYLLMSEVGERMYAKPRGYAGDFLTIELMYRDRPGGVGRLGPVIDRACREQPANRAVVNRRPLLVEEIERALAGSAETARVTSLASGPAAELFDVFDKLDDPTRLAATCIDIDLQALAFVGDRCEKRKLRKQFRLENGNLVYLASGRQQIDLPPQDLIYSIGLIDYFADPFVVALLDYVHDRLRPGGRVILGNFHPQNSNKALMDFVFDWKLIHRSEADMDRLFASSKFGQGSTNLRFEEGRVNLFAECTRRA